MNGKYIKILIGFVPMIISILVTFNSEMIRSPENMISFFSALLTLGIILAVYSLLKPKKRSKKQDY